MDLSLSYNIEGIVESVKGINVIAYFPGSRIGDLVEIESSSGYVIGKALSFDNNLTTYSVFGETTGISPGGKIIKKNFSPKLKIKNSTFGSVINAFGEFSIESDKNTDNDRLECLIGNYSYDSNIKSLNDRLSVNQVFSTGIKVIDSFNTLGKGQRIIVTAEPGVGKSSLLMSLINNSESDLNVVAMIGERGREVAEFYESIKFSPAINRTIIVASTSDESSVMRAKAAETALRISEIASCKGLNVLLAFDSLTRYARSLRDIGLSSGELPIRRGYPASVFDKLPKFIERVGKFRNEDNTTGSITAVYTMLKHGELDDDPILEEVKGLTDGHLVLDKKMSERGIYPALDITKSLSRLQNRFWNKEEQEDLREIKKIYSEILEEQDILLMSGNKEDLSINSTRINLIYSFISQDLDTKTCFEELKLKIKELLEKLRIESVM